MSRPPLFRPLNVSTLSFWPLDVLPDGCLVRYTFRPLIFASGRTVRPKGRFIKIWLFQSINHNLDNTSFENFDFSKFN